MKSTKRVGQPPTPKSEPRDYRKELWIGVAIAVAAAENAIEKSAPAAWADVALDRYDDLFGDSE